MLRNDSKNPNNKHSRDNNSSGFSSVKNYSNYEMMIQRFVNGADNPVRSKSKQMNRSKKIILSNLSPILPVKVFSPEPRMQTSVSPLEVHNIMSSSFHVKNG